MRCIFMINQVINFAQGFLLMGLIVFIMVVLAEKVLATGITY